MLTDKKWQLDSILEFEKRLERMLQRIEAASALAGAPDPICSRSVFLEPREWGGKQKLAARAHQVGQSAEETCRIGEAAEQVGREHHVEGFSISDLGLWIGIQIHRVALLEGNSLAGDLWRDFDHSGFGEITLDCFLERMASGFAKEICGLDEGMGEVDAEHFAARPGEFETRAADRAPEIECAGIHWQGCRIEEFPHEPGGKANRSLRAGHPVEYVRRTAVVQQQVLGEQFG